MCVVVIILFFVQQRKATALNERAVDGFWIADESFCKSAAVDHMMMFIGKNDGVGRNVVRQGYLIIGPDITNQPFTVSWTRPTRHDLSAPYRVAAEFDFTDSCDIANEVTAEFNVATGQLRLFDADDETIYGVFYRNNEISACFDA